MKFQGYVLVSDIDGTLVNHEWNITAENKEAIAYFQREGGKFTIATGRIPGRVKRVAEQVRIDLPIICYNGACIYDLQTGETMWQHLLEGNVTAIADEIPKRVENVGIQIYANHKIYMAGRNSEIASVTFLDENVIQVADYKTVPKPWAKLMFIVRKDKMHLVREAVAQSENKGDFAYMQSSPEYYEVLHPLTSKGNALENLARMQNLDMDKIIAVGDNENDVDMVKKAGFGFMTRDAEKIYQKAADFICGSCEKDSIASVVRKMEKICSENA